MKLNDDVQKINTRDKEKGLGITFDKMLSCDLHFQNAVNKTNQMIGLIKRILTYLNKGKLIKLYMALVRPHLEYGNVIWYPR